MTDCTPSHAPADDGWESLIARGREQAQHGQWEDALRTYDSAQKHFTGPGDERRRVTLKNIAFAHRCLGRYNDALQTLDELLKSLEPTDRLRLKVFGDMGVLYRHLDRLEDAAEACQKQYDLASQLRAEQQVCRAVGNLGVINYQLWRRNGDEKQLATATDQLLERIRRARALKEVFRVDPDKSGKEDYLSTLEAVGLARLSLCCSASGNQRAALVTAKQSLAVAERDRDPSVEAISRFFYGLALLRDGQKAEALRQFDLPSACSPAVAFCKEPSSENQQFLLELLEAGAKMDSPDENGYTALDYAVFNQDTKSEQIVLESVKRRLNQEKCSDVEEELYQRVEEARLRKSYREIFQERMRPILLAADGDVLHQVRLAYAEALHNNAHTAKAFDAFKFVRYDDFKVFGKFPRSNDGLTQQFAAPQQSSASHVVFVSYRWVNRDPRANFPDDPENKQYRRTIQAVEAYLLNNPSVEANKLGIWIDFACINQDEPMPGIAALPMAIAQCDALISLVDDQYHERAWCSVEVMLIHALRKAYRLHHWYEHTITKAEEATQYITYGFRAGPGDMEINPQTKQLRFEEDMPRVKFLQRQCRLLC